METKGFFFNMESSFINVLGYLNADHVIGIIIQFFQCDIDFRRQNL